MFGQPGASLGTIVTGEVVGDDEDVAGRIVGFDVLFPRDAQRTAPLGESGSRASFMAFVSALMKRHCHALYQQA